MLVYGRACFGGGVHEVHHFRCDKHATHHHAERLAASQLACSRPAEQDGHEIETGVVEPVVERVVFDAVGSPEVEHAGPGDDRDGAEHRGRHHHGDECDHGFRQVVEDIAADALGRERFCDLLIEVFRQGALARCALRCRHAVDMHDEVEQLLFGGRSVVGRLDLACDGAGARGRFGILRGDGLEQPGVFRFERLALRDSLQQVADMVENLV